MNGKNKVIVILQDVIASDVLALKLQQLGFVVDKAQDGATALQKMNAAKPDCIVLDICMQNKAGIVFFEQLTADATLKDIPTILVADAEEKDEVKRARALGAKEILVKAVFEPNDAAEKVKQILGAPASVAPAQAPAPAPVAAAPAPAAGSVAADPNKPFVLVIEDDKFLRELLVRKLASDGFDVQNATDSTAAFLILKERKPAIILLDLILPEVSGFEILTLIKANPKIASVPVIILSNLGQKEDTDKAMALGAKDFMVKANFTLDEIIAKVRATIG